MAIPTDHAPLAYGSGPLREHAGRGATQRRCRQGPDGPAVHRLRRAEALFNRASVGRVRPPQDAVNDRSCPASVISAPPTAATVAPHRGLPEARGPPPACRRCSPAGAIAINLRWSWDERGEPVQVGRSSRSGSRRGTTQSGLLGHVSHERFRASCSDPAFLVPRGGPRRSTATSRAPAGSDQGRVAATCLAYFSGVRDRRDPAAVLRRPRRPRRRPPEGRSDARRTPRGRRALLQAGLLPQALNGDGWQQEAYPKTLDPFGIGAARYPMSLKVRSTSPAGPLTPRSGDQVGRIRLYLLDSDIADNDEDGRGVTDRLYGGGTDTAYARRSCSASAAYVRSRRPPASRCRSSTRTRATRRFLGLERIRAEPMSDDGAHVRSRQHRGVPVPRPCSPRTHRCPRGWTCSPPLIERYFATTGGPSALTEHQPSPSATAPTRRPRTRSTWRSWAAPRPGGPTACRKAPR